MAQHSTKEPVISLCNVTLRFGDTCALDDVTMRIAPGEHICILGANGSGKSTLASVICGILAPDEGHVELLGQRVFSDESGVDFAAYATARQSIGLVFQNPDDQIVTSVVEEDVAFGPENLGLAPNEIGARVERELTRVALREYAKANPAHLSGGQKQRVAIAGALAMEPQVLVLDEPGALLDVRGRRAIMRTLDELHTTGTTIVHITHYMDEALEADRVIVLKCGQVVLEGTPEEVFAHDGMLATLGLELPFAAQFSRKLRDSGLPVAFTCDEAILQAELLDMASRNDRPTATNTDFCPHQTGVIDIEKTAVSARDLVYSYAGNHTQAHRALNMVNLDIHDASSVALVGHTGSGKSTLLRLIAALETPDTGQLIVCDIDTRSPRNRRRLHGRVGYVMQHPERQLFAETVWEDVAFGPYNLGLSEQEVTRRCQQALKLVGLFERSDVSPFELSGGQKRLCAIAGILAMEPQLLILDEPTAGLDPKGRAQLRKILTDVHKRGTTLIQVTHSMEDAALAEQVIVLTNGQVLLDGAPQEVFSQDHEKLLRAHGLGLPQPLAYARQLERTTTLSLGDPLCLDALVDAVASQFLRGV